MFNVNITIVVTVSVTITVFVGVWLLWRSHRDRVSRDSITELKTKLIWEWTKKSGKPTQGSPDRLDTSEN